MRQWISAMMSVAASAAIVSASTSISVDRQAQSAPSVELAALETQVLLDRAGFSPGVIDGTGGPNTTRALEAFKAAHNQIPPSASVEPIVSYTITVEDTAGPFTLNIPRDMMEKSKLQGLNYTSVLEALSEKFHSSRALLKRLNPAASFTMAEQIRVPNVMVFELPAPSVPRSIADRKPPAVTTQKAKADAAPAVTVFVSKSASALKVSDQRGQIIFYAPVTSGSEHDPLPLGTWAVTAVLRNPNFNYNPDLFWDANPAHAKAKIPAGPNNPVGVVWIDISKPHYGIHGTDEPGRIGVSVSHGCVRLTNWDALRLADLVAKGTPVVFGE